MGNRTLYWKLSSLNYEDVDLQYSRYPNASPPCDLIMTVNMLRCATMMEIIVMLR